MKPLKFILQLLFAASLHAATFISPLVFVAAIPPVVIQPTNSFVVSPGVVELNWIASGDTSVIGYQVFYGTNSYAAYLAAYSGTATDNNYGYTTSIDVGSVTSYTVTNLTHGTTYYFAVTAYDATGQVSDFSNEISRTP